MIRNMNIWFGLCRNPPPDLGGVEIGNMFRVLFLN